MEETFANYHAARLLSRDNIADYSYMFLPYDFIARDYCAREICVSIYLCRMTMCISAYHCVQLTQMPSFSFTSGPPRLREPPSGHRAKRVISRDTRLTYVVAKQRKFCIIDNNLLIIIYRFLLNLECRFVVKFFTM